MLTQDEIMTILLLTGCTITNEYLRVQTSLLQGVAENLGTVGLVQIRKWLTDITEFDTKIKSQLSEGNLIRKKVDVLEKEWSSSGSPLTLIKASRDDTLAKLFGVLGVTPCTQPVAISSSTWGNFTY